MTCTERVWVGGQATVSAVSWDTCLRQPAHWRAAPAHQRGPRLLTVFTTSKLCISGCPAPWGGEKERISEDGTIAL